MNPTLKILLHRDSDSTGIGNEPYGCCNFVAVVRRGFDPSIGPGDLLQSEKNECECEGEGQFTLKRRI